MPLNRPAIDETEAPIPEETLIRRARSRFVAMAAAYSLGVFNDNFFKQAILMLAVAGGHTDLQGKALSVFTLPFLLVAAPAGWLADRFSKRRVVIGAKTAELIAISLGATALITGNWPLTFVMLFLMGTQAAVFSPALNGSLPELYPASYVPKANGILRMLVTMAILSGVALAGVALDARAPSFFGIQPGRLWVSLVVLAVSLLGLGISLGVPHRPAAAPRAPFPWSGPLETMREILATRKDPLLAIALGADVFIWFAGSLQVLLLNPLGLQQLRLDKTTTSLLIATQLIGIGIGGLLSAWKVKGPTWYRALGPSGVAMSLIMLCLCASPALPSNLRLPVMFGAVGLIGTFGGLFLIPTESFVQVRPDPARKGTVLSAANFLIFGGILLSGPIADAMNAHLLPTHGFGLVGCFSLVVSLMLWWKLRKGHLR